MLADEVGEHLYRAAPLRAEGRDDALMPVTPTDVVNAWGAESADYAPASGACAPGRQCGHYTAIRLAHHGGSRVRHGRLPLPGAGLGLPDRPKGNVRMLR